MGNTPSHSNTPSGGTPAVASQATQSTSTTPQPVPTRLPGSTTPAYHSGITPPAQPPSPPPPSTPLLLPYAGHLSPQNPHALTQPHDYSKGIVTGLILEAKLAPFYRGLEDWEEYFTEEDASRILSQVRQSDLDSGVQNSVTEAVKSGMDGSVAKRIGIHKRGHTRREEEREERDKRERRAYVGATECPICFLNYPPNINTSRCCQQPICTECFVQMKRSEATVTHLESDPACCPFCMETDFGVIYERPQPLAEGSALATSPALSLSPDELSIGMAPKAQERMRRKSVSSKAQEVVTIDEIRPDWEVKLNAVKAAAARKSARRIVMRQVGDRLVPIGFTSSRATGQADFSMSVPPDTEPRRRRAGSSRDLEELMIMEAMRLSLLDHEQQRDERPSIPSGSQTPDRRQADIKSSSAAQKLLSKFNGGRSRSSSSASASKVTFAPSAGPSSRRESASALGVPSPAPNPAPSAPSGMPRLSLDMPALEPERHDAPQRPVPVREDTDMSTASTVGPSYAQLESDEE